MNNVVETSEQLDIRRAIDKLQKSFEELGERFRDVRREKRQQHEYIVELEREVDRLAKGAGESERSSTVERARAEEALDLLQQGERRCSELMHRITELEQAVAERETLVAEQEDLIQQYQVRFDEARDYAGRQEAAREAAEQRLASTAGDLNAALEEIAALRIQRDELADASDSRSDAKQQVESLDVQLQVVRGSMQSLEAERAELISRQQALTAELEEIREREAVGRTGVEELESRCTSAEAHIRELESRLATTERERDAAEADAAAARKALVESSPANGSAANPKRAEALEEELSRSRSALAEKDNAVLTASRQVERLKNQLTLFEQQVDELRAEREKLLRSAGNSLTEADREAVLGELQNAVRIIDGYLSEV